MANTNSAAHVRVIEETPAYWRVVFDYPPFNIVDASIFEALQDLLARMNASPSLRVVVFESANPEFYLAHFDLTGKIGNIMTAVGASANPKSGWDCIQVVAVRNASHIWSGAVGRLKSSSARTTSTARRRNDTDTSTGHFQTPNWTASSTRSPAGSPPSTGVPSPPRRISSTMSRCRPPTGSSPPSLLLRPR